MPNYGIKIMKGDKDISSQDIGDHIFWSKYPPLTFLNKVTRTINITSTNGVPSGGTDVYAHGYNFIPLVFAAFFDNTDQNKYFLPIRDVNINGLYCDGNHILSAAFSYTINATQVIIDHTVYCASVIQGIEDAAVSGSGTIKIDLYFYMWKMGSTWN
jgi:hypothetical protein